LSEVHLDFDQLTDQLQMCSALCCVTVLLCWVFQ